MTVSHQKHAVGVFSIRDEAEQALILLKESGFPMDKVSIIVRDAHKEPQIAGAQVSDRVGDQNVQTATGVVANTLAGSALGSVLVGLGSLAIPGVGVVIAAGSVGLALAATTASTGIEAAAIGGLVKAISDLGIPEEQARAYSDRLHRDHYLVIVDGTDEEIGRAEAIFSKRGIEDWGIFSSPSA